MNFEFNAATLAFIATFGSIQVVATGVVAFLAKWWLARDREKISADVKKRLMSLQHELTTTTKHLEAGLEQSLHMHKLRFQTEFEIYSELWPKVRRLQEASHHLTIKRRDDSLDERLIALSSATDKLRGAVEDRRPFFEAAIASELFALLALANKVAEEEAAFRAGHPEIGIPRAGGVRNLLTMGFACSQICELIRTRITGSAVALEPPPGLLPAPSDVPLLK